MVVDKTGLSYGREFFEILEINPKLRKFSRFSQVPKSRGQYGLVKPKNYEIRKFSHWLFKACLG